MRLKKQLFIKYVHEKDISINKIPISIIFLIKIGASYWEADGKGAKLELVIKVSQRAGTSTWLNGKTENASALSYAICYNTTNYRVNEIYCIYKAICNVMQLILKHCSSHLCWCHRFKVNHIDKKLVLKILS